MPKAAIYGLCSICNYGLKADLRGSAAFRKFRP